MKIIGYLLLALALAGFATVWLHVYAHQHILPTAAWVYWFGHIPLSADPYSHRLPILFVSSTLLFVVGVCLVDPKKKSRNRKEDEL